MRLFARPSGTARRQARIVPARPGRAAAAITLALTCVLFLPGAGLASGGASLAGVVLTPQPGATPQAQQADAAADAEMVQEEGPVLELTLLETVEMALRHNLQVEIASYTPDLQEESIISSRQQFDPVISFNLPQSFSRSSQQATNQLSGADVTTQETFSGGFSFSHFLEWGTNWSLSWNANRNVSNSSFNTFNPRIFSSLNLNVQQPLLRGFGSEVNTANIVIAQNSFESSREGFRQQVQNIVFQTYQAYWELVFAIEDLAVNQLALDLARQQLQRNNVQVEIGTLAPIETIQAERQVASSELALLQAQVARRDREDDLKRLLNIDEAVDQGWAARVMPTDEPERTAESIDVEAAIQTALERDPALIQRRIDARTRRLNLSTARNALLPQVNFTGSIQLSGQGGDQLITTGGFGQADVLEIQEGGFSDALRNLMSGDFRNWSLGISVQFPIYNWAAKAQHAQAVINERSTLAQIRDREQQVRVEVLQAARQVESGVQQVAQATTARELAERQLDAEERKFAVGTSTNFQVLDFQRQLVDAQSAELRSIINFNNAIARLEQAKGTLLESLGVGIGMATVRTNGVRRIR